MREDGGGRVSRIKVADLGCDDFRHVGQRRKGHAAPGGALDADGKDFDARVHRLAEFGAARGVVEECRREQNDDTA